VKLQVTLLCAVPKPHMPQVLAQRWPLSRSRLLWRPLCTHSRQRPLLPLLWQVA
jgi:hypothetical protein